VSTCTTETSLRVHPVTARRAKTRSCGEQAWAHVEDIAISSLRDTAGAPRERDRSPAESQLVLP
jgi:hypothetical protein